jgi:hypothetical protein
MTTWVRGGKGESLGRCVHRWEEHASANSERNVLENPFHHGRARAEETDEAGTQSGEHPAGPERPAVVTRLRSNDTDDHARGRNGQGLG